MEFDKYLRKPIVMDDMHIVSYGFVENEHCYRKGYVTTTGGGELIAENNQQARRWYFEMLMQEAIGNC